MSEIDADLDRAAAAYWLSVASKSGPEKNCSLGPGGQPAAGCEGGSAYSR